MKTLSFACLCFKQKEKVIMKFCVFPVFSWNLQNNNIVAKFISQWEGINNILIPQVTGYHDCLYGLLSSQELFWDGLAMNAN